MANKVPRFPSSFETQEKKDLFAETERIVNELEGNSFKFKDEQGNFLGPFGVLCYAPKTFQCFLDYTKAFISAPFLTPKERELSTLAAASVTRNEFVEYAHQRIGVSVGLTQDQVERASKGHGPKGLSEREECVYELALELARNFGSIKDDRFHSAVAVLGRDGVSQLAQMVGGYMLISVLERVGDGAVPKS